jgi:uncharacterized protein YlxW (UPF0749 family)
LTSPRRRLRRPARRDATRGPAWALALPFVVVGFGLVVAGTTTGQRRQAEQPRRQRLVALIENRRDQVADLDRAVRDLRGRASRAQAAASRLDASDSARARRLASLGEMAGTVAVEGPGVEVRLSDATRPAPAGADAEVSRIHDRDVQLVVNALFAAGAEAVSINDVRLVATSPIRAAGETIVVSFRPLSPPYVVRAIGADDADFAKSDVARLFGRWRSLFGLGYQVHERERLVVPAFTGRVAVASAHPS